MKAKLNAELNVLPPPPYPIQISGYITDYVSIKKFFMTLLTLFSE